MKTEVNINIDIITWAIARSGYQLQEFNITPEVLMVFGHAQDTEKSLQKAVVFTLDMVEKFGAVPRPYIAKDIVPGNSGWHDPKNASRVETFIQHPEFFQALDFSALPSSLTHPDPALRQLAAKFFMMITSITQNTTQVVYPFSPDIDEETAQMYRQLNIGRYDN